MKKFFFIIFVVLALFSTGCESTVVPDKIINNWIKPSKYVNLLGRGMDVDWAKTTEGISNYKTKTTVDFKEKGIQHVRIRIKNDATEQFLPHIDKIVNDCLKQNLIPIIAYQGNDFKNNPNKENLAKVVEWWKIVSTRYKDYSPLLSYDLIIEVTDALNKEPEELNNLYEQVVTEIRKTNPNRILFISPRLRSSPEYLTDLVIPTKHNNYLMVEWHFYAAGPSKSNKKKLWTIGTEYEKNIIKQKIKLATNWQTSTGIYTWVGAWMPGNYNKENNFTIAEQIAFASYLSCQLDSAKIPFAINSDTKFYDREKNKWLSERVSVLNAILNTGCKKQ